MTQKPRVTDGTLAWRPDTEVTSRDPAYPKASTPAYSRPYHSSRRISWS